MTESLFITSAAIIGYIIGSISFAVIVAKYHGVNILKEGSCNPGATNVKRVIGKKAGNFVFFLDFLKGYIATAWPLFLIKDTNLSFYMALAGMVCVILGHSFSIFLKFKGGKGVASTMGAMLALIPFALGIGLIVWLVTFFATRIVSLASILFAVSLPVTVFFSNLSQKHLYTVIILSLFILYRHKSNIMRLFQGNEKGFTKKEK